MEKPSYIYILASARYGTLYTGVTANLIKRTWLHKNDISAGFTKTYGVHMLVWYETYTSIVEAITREKQLKHWKRVWKIKLISTHNPEWRDLYDEICS